MLNKKQDLTFEGGRVPDYYIDLNELKQQATVANIDCPRVLHENSIAAQFETVKDEATGWAFETLFDWAKYTMNIARHSGALSKRAYNSFSEQLCRAARKGKDALLIMLYNWYIGAIMNVEGELAYQRV